MVTDMMRTRLGVGFCRTELGATFCISYPPRIMADSNTVKPVATFRAPHGLAASVFKNDGKSSEYFKVSLQRSYKKGTEFETKRISLGRDDLLAVAELATRSWNYIADAEVASRKQNAKEDEGSDEE